MRIVGVLDLAAGLAVHAVAGDRRRYAPVTSVAGSRIDSGDPLAVAQVYLERLAITELYIADLDAIGSRGRSQDSLVAALVACGSPVWLDAGITSVAQARHARALGAASVVVGLETLTSYDALSEICAAAGGGVAFSLDLRSGVPVLGPGLPAADSAEAVATRAVRCGVESIIVIDLARVGTGVGFDLELIGRLRAAVPSVRLLAGGGVRGRADLDRLADAGCDGALVATALHDGRLSADDIRAARQRQPRATR
jgi:phosphoribosylformimino-5-aminoimidazole carboxamide ribotide isomerase